MISRRTVRFWPLREMVKDQAADHAVEALIPIWERGTVIGVDIHVQSRPGDLLSGQRQYLPVDVDPAHHGFRDLPLHHDGQSPGAAAEIEHPVAGAKAGLFQQGPLEFPLAHEVLEAGIEEGRQELEPQSRDVSQGLYLFKRSELLTTETDEKAMAAPAMTGERKPRAATGMPSTL